MASPSSSTGSRTRPIRSRARWWPTVDGAPDPIEVVRWKEIYGRLESAADMSEDVANVIEAIVLKNR
jgi:hypothetical protein